MLLRSRLLTIARRGKIPTKDEITYFKKFCDKKNMYMNFRDDKFSKRNSTHNKYGKSLIGILNTLHKNESLYNKLVGDPDEYNTIINFFQEHANSVYPKLQF